MNKKFLPMLFLAIALCLVLVSCTEINGNHTHKFEETIFEPNCKEMGFTQLLCIECGYEMLMDYKPRSTHKGDWQLTKEPTCQSIGTEEKLCLTCNIVFETRSVAKLGHTQGEWTVTKQPTCNEAGEEKIFCKGCSIALESKAINATDEHEFATKITPPTSTEQGYTTYTCKICDFSKKDDYVSIKQETTAYDIYSKVSNAMVRVDAYDKSGRRCSLGSGFFISADGKIATNYHVIDTAYTLKVELYSDKSVHAVARILGYNEAQDVAVIQIDLDNTPHLEISTEPVKVGDVVYTLGSPKGVDNIFTTGMISNPSVTVSGKECIAFTAPISSGNSGGPLLNSEGEVIGINSMKIVDGENFNLAILAKQITDLNLNNPITTEAHYHDKLPDNAFGILAYYIIFNADSISGEQYAICDTIKETSSSVGFDCYFVYDGETGIITLRVYVIKNSKMLYMFELEMSKVSDSYYVYLYDIAAGQYTIEAEAFTAMSANSYYNDFDNLFDIFVFRYVEGDSISPDNMKQVFFMYYQVAMNQFKKLIQNSNTGLLMSHFNFNF